MTTKTGTIVGLVISVVLHLVLITPVMVHILTAQNDRQVLRARFEPDDFLQEPYVPPEDHVQLGIDSEQAPSTMTWVGYEQYEEHLAHLAEFEQAAFASNIPPAAMVTPSESVPTPPVPPEETLPEPPEASPDEDKGQDPDVIPVDLVAEGKPHETPPPPSQAETPPKKLVQPSQPPTPVAEPQPVPAPVPPPDVEPEPGELSDRESAATSTVEIPLDMIKRGKPLAAHGLELKPRRPSFSTLILITASPGNPLVEMKFGRRGRPLEASILEGSGDGRVDAAILSSLYRWRATGESLAELADDETIDISIRIMLRSKRRPK